MGTSYFITANIDHLNVFNTDHNTIQLSQQINSIDGCSDSEIENHKFCRLAFNGKNSFYLTDKNSIYLVDSKFKLIKKFDCSFGDVINALCYNNENLYVGVYDANKAKCKILKFNSNLELLDQFSNI